MKKDEINMLLERFDETESALHRAIVAQLIQDRLVLVTALKESVNLQSHYAGLLNIYDGGERIGFVDAQAWIDRLVECKKIPPDHGCKIS